MLRIHAGPVGAFSCKTFIDSRALTCPRTKPTNNNDDSNRVFYACVCSDNVYIIIQLTPTPLHKATFVYMNRNTVLNAKQPSSALSSSSSTERRVTVCPGLSRRPPTKCIQHKYGIAKTLQFNHKRTPI